MLHEHARVRVWLFLSSVKKFLSPHELPVGQSSAAGRAHGYGRARLDNAFSCWEALFCLPHQGPGGLIRSGRATMKGSPVCPSRV